MGLTDSSLNTVLKPFTFLTHCKANCNSPCCQSLCGDDNHCQCSIDTTAEDSSSSSSSDGHNHTPTKTNFLLNKCYILNMQETL